MYTDLPSQLELTIHNSPEDPRTPDEARKSLSPAESTVSIPPATEWLKPGT